MPRPPKCHIISLKTVVGQLCKPHNMKNERLVSKMEGKTNFSRHLKQFDGLARLTPTLPLPLILRQIYAVVFADVLYGPHRVESWFELSLLFK